MPWFHKITFPDGTVTPGKKDCEALLPAYGLTPELFAGKTVLDIGCNDGFYSFWAERCGAARVVAVDDYKQWPSGPGNFDIAHRTFKSRVELRILDIMESLPADFGRFDVVLFMGVFYHLLDPWRGLRNAIRATGETLVVESHIANVADNTFPAMRFYPHGKISCEPTDPWVASGTDFWGPNNALLDVMLRKEFEAVIWRPVHNGARSVFIAQGRRPPSLDNGRV